MPCIEDKILESIKSNFISNSPSINEELRKLHKEVCPACAHQLRASIQKALFEQYLTYTDGLTTDMVLNINLAFIYDLIYTSRLALMDLPSEKQIPTEERVLALQEFRDQLFSMYSDLLGDVQPSRSAH